MGEILRISLTFSNLMPRDRQRFGREIFNRSERPLFGKMTSKFPSCIKFEGSERDQSEASICEVVRGAFGLQEIHLSPTALSLLIFKTKFWNVGRDLGKNRSFD